MLAPIAQAKQADNAPNIAEGNRVAKSLFEIAKTPFIIRKKVGIWWAFNADAIRPSKSL